MVRITAAYSKLLKPESQQCLIINRFSYYGVWARLVLFIILLLQVVASVCPQQAGTCK